MLALQRASHPNSVIDVAFACRDGAYTVSTKILKLFKYYC